MKAGVVTAWQAEIEGKPKSNLARSRSTTLFVRSPFEDRAPMCTLNYMWCNVTRELPRLTLSSSVAARAARSWLIVWAATLCLFWTLGMSVRVTRTCSPVNCGPKNSESVGGRRC